MSIEAMKQALLALEDWKIHMRGDWDVIDEQAIKSLRQAIAQAEKQEPKPLVGLTLQEVSDIWDSMGTWSSTNIQAVYNAIWKAIKIGRAHV